MPTPKWSDIRRFCERDRWDPKKLTDHWRYTKKVGDRTLRTRASFKPGTIDDPDLFAALLREQLAVDEDEFWRVIREGGPARRAQPAPSPTAPVVQLDASTVLQLRNLGATPNDVRRLRSQAEAEELLARLASAGSDTGAEDGSVQSLV